MRVTSSPILAERSSPQVRVCMECMLAGLVVQSCATASSLLICAAPCRKRAAGVQTAGARRQRGSAYREHGFRLPGSTMKSPLATAALRARQLTRIAESRALHHRRAPGSRGLNTLGTLEGGVGHANGRITWRQEPRTVCPAGQPPQHPEHQLTRSTASTSSTRSSPCCPPSF